MYNNIEYIVMAEDTVNGTVDLISANGLQVNNNNVNLGNGDQRSVIAVPVVNENEITSEEKAERARWSYNNMVETLVMACKDATGLTVDGTEVISVRSVGNTNVKYTSNGITGTDNPGTYVYDWQTAGAESDWYTSNGYNSYNMKVEDNNYQSDWSILGTLGIRTADNSLDYWLASRFVRTASETVTFGVYYGASYGGFGQQSLCFEKLNNESSSYNDMCVRPVITLNSSVLASY